MHQSATFPAMNDRLVANHGIRVLAQNWDRGPRNFITMRPVATIEDLEVLKIRVPPQES